MINLSAASKLLNFGARIGDGPRADEQLKGAVAIHNILARHGVAYLADEVGMGKTYVALGALALFRHFDPQFRVLFIAPRGNIQSKWMKELRNFVAHNVRYPDLRVKAIDGRPARALVACDNLLGLVEEATVDPNRDFFVRLTSFSLALGGRDSVDAESGRKLRERLRGSLPWLPDEIFDLRSKQTFKDNVARAVCSALPSFDLVIIDEGHNLKHGWSEDGAARNRVLSLVLGRVGGADAKLFPNFGSRAKRVLLLSATPIDETYRHLWNQLDLVGRSAKFGALRSNDEDEDAKKEAARTFLVRRVTSIAIDGQDHTKNMYRREWRSGGLLEHDQPIKTTDPKQRLVVALVQKKVSELLQSERFGASFQIGMLASFESFLETTGVKRLEDEVANFDDNDQTEDQDEREGIDVRDVNSLARSYRERFNEELPHPKMDALVSSLARSWERGEKALVFVRRVASVTELKRKLDDCYDKWLIARLYRELPERVHGRLDSAVSKYEAEKREARSAKADGPTQQADDVDAGGKDTFFAWFFRGAGPRGFISGANVQQRFIQRGATYATFFEDNYVANLLGCDPSEVEVHLAEALGVDVATLRDDIRCRTLRFLTRAKRHARGDRFEAVQAAGVEALKDHPGPVQASARLVWRERFESSLRTPHATEAPDIGGWLGLRTFFTELRSRPNLRARLWPLPTTMDERLAFRERELRAQLLASTARLGHAFIDLYVMTIQRIGSLDLRAQDEADDTGTDTAVAQIADYLDLLEMQRTVALNERGWRAFDELAEVAAHFDLVVDVNAPEARTQPLAETTTEFGRLLRQQQPVGGMSGQVNQTLVRQFRMPGYPLLLITTDLLQEGEDLHTFCSAVHHYGVSWTPSSMEQRIGRIDRVRSQTERRLSVLDRPAIGEEMLQVYFPHLDDTVEVLQVQRVLERMNVFLRLMHEGLTTGGVEDKKIDVASELVRGRRAILQISTRLKTAFPIAPEQLEGSVNELAFSPKDAEAVERRFLEFARSPIGLDIAWEIDAPPGSLFGTVRLAARHQPFALRLQSLGDRLLVRCVSPVGRVGPEQARDEILASIAKRRVRIGAIAATNQEHTYDLTVEDDVLLADDPATDSQRVAMLITRVAEEADALEQHHLPGHDEALAAFRAQLEEEGHRDR